MVKKNLFIINYGFPLGGAETFITKIFPKLTDDYKIYLVLISNNINSNLLKLIPNNISIIRLQKVGNFLKMLLLNKIHIDVLYTTLPPCFIFGLLLFSLSRNKSLKFIVSPHQTESFCTPYKFYQLHRMITRFAFKVIPSENIIYLNSSTQQHHQEKLNKSFDKSTIINLFVDVDKFLFLDRRKLPRKKVISIGRLSHIKSYNLTLLPIFKKLEEAGMDIEWHIYGQGELETEMHELVDSMNINNVFLHGSIDYSSMNNVMKDCFLFIGSGTALIEASSAGLPSITTIEYSTKAESYGFLCDIQGDSFIEPNLKLKKYDIYTLINKIKNCDNKTYSDMQKKSRDKALTFSHNIIEQYDDVFRLASPLKLNKLLTVAIFFVYIVFASINRFIFYKK